MPGKVNAILKPRILVSRCLGFDHCRYDGATIDSEVVRSLMPFVEFITVCPEMAIGLGVPRDPIRVIKKNASLILFQPATKSCLTREMRAFCAEFINGLGPIDGAILKSRSPSCGIKDVKIYSGKGEANPIATGKGFFGNAVLTAFPHLPVEDEGRLLNLRIREHFLTRLFINARWRWVAATQKMKELVQFHSENKLLYMANNESGMRVLGRIVANPEKKPASEVFSRYGEVFYRTLERLPRIGNNVNVLTHALGYFSRYLTAREKRFFLHILETYRRGKVPLNVCLGVMNSWIVRFDEKYLAHQSYFAPYPEELITVYDSGKGRDIP